MRTSTIIYLNQSRHLSEVFVYNEMVIELVEHDGYRFYMWYLCLSLDTQLCDQDALRRWISIELQAQNNVWDRKESKKDLFESMYSLSFLFTYLKICSAIVKCEADVSSFLFSAVKTCKIFEHFLIFYISIFFIFLIFLFSRQCNRTLRQFLILAN